MEQDIKFDLEELVALVHELLLAPSPNPPGDVRAAALVAIDFFDRHDIAHEVLEQKPGLINLIASVDGLKETPEPKHLVMNAHLDVFPAAAGQRTDRTGDTIYGRGAVDMKGGAGAFMMALATLKQHRDAFAGRVTLILVCDEETFGPHGSLAVVAEHPELFGDYLLSSEPSSVGVVRYGERGHIWSKVTFTGAAGHSAYPGTDESPIERAAKFITALKEKIFEDSPKISEADADEDILAPTGASYVDQISLNFGRVSGGVKVNMKAASCEVEVDLRLPVGVSVESQLRKMRDVACRLSGEIEVMSSGEANVSDLNNELFATIASAAEAEGVARPKFGVGLGCTDARIWRFRGIPAAVYGPSPYSMASDNEHILISELDLVARVHLRTILTLLAPEV